MKIGDVARLAGTTTRTIRYYEEIGLLATAGDRPAGGHRAYTDADVERLKLILRLKSLLGVSLDELRDLVAAEEARVERREEFQRTEDPERRRALLHESLASTDRQLEPFIHNMHTALWVLAATSLVGTAVSLLRPRT
jgi:DNA-binding transcriptional MerR regulator